MDLTAPYFLVLVLHFFINPLLPDVTQTAIIPTKSLEHCVTERAKVVGHFKHQFKDSKFIDHIEARCEKTQFIVAELQK